MTITAIDTQEQRSTTTKRKLKAPCRHLFFKIHLREDKNAEL